MHFYRLATVFRFGQHQGQTVQQVLQVNPSYLSFCVRALGHFALRRADVLAWQQQFPALYHWMNAEAWNYLDAKEAALNRPPANYDYDGSLDDYWEHRSRHNDRGIFDALTDGQYGDYESWGGNLDSLRDTLGY